MWKRHLNVTFFHRIVPLCKVNSNSRDIAIMSFVLSNNIQLKEKIALLYVTISDQYRDQYNVNFYETRITKHKYMS